MKNTEMMTLTISRKNVIDIKMALADLMIEFRDEARDEELSDTRREIAAKSAARWEALRAEITRQFEEQDT